MMPHQQHQNPFFLLFVTTVLLSLITLAPTSRADPKEGRVKVVGSEGNVITALADADNQEHRLCAGAISRRIGHLAGMKVQVNGKPLDQGGTSCFDASEFKIIDTGSGRAPIVGTLLRRDGIGIQTDDGSFILLERAPPGLQNLVGRRVIVDARPLDAKNLTPRFKVVTYAAWP